MSETAEIFFRPATNRDAERVRHLVFGVLSEYGLKGDPETTDKDLSDLEASYARRGGVFEILEDARGNLLGTVGLYPINDETVELRKMYFAKSLRGRGLGKRALERMIEEARRGEAFAGSISKLTASSKKPFTSTKNTVSSQRTKNTPPAATRLIHWTFNIYHLSEEFFDK